jgi:hypothetical protein
MSTQPSDNDGGVNRSLHRIFYDNALAAVGAIESRRSTAAV